MLIGITGGIGSGKSVVAHVCESRGYAVYDCDLRARVLMQQSETIRSELCRLMGEDVLDCDNCLNRPYIAARIFADNLLRDRVNRLVHEAVRNDILRSVAMMADDKLMFVESAIMRTSALDLMMDSIWLVTAPDDIRMQRVQCRNGFDTEHIRQRMEAQWLEYTGLRCPKVYTIVNDNKQSLLLQIDALLSQELHADE